MLRLMLRLASPSGEKPSIGRPMLRLPDLSSERPMLQLMPRLASPSGESPVSACPCGLSMRPVHSACPYTVVARSIPDEADAPPGLTPRLASPRGESPVSVSRPYCGCQIGIWGWASPLRSGGAQLGGCFAATTTLAVSNPNVVRQAGDKVGLRDLHVVSPGNLTFLVKASTETLPQVRDNRRRMFGDECD